MAGKFVTRAPGKLLNIQARLPAVLAVICSLSTAPSGTAKQSYIAASQTSPAQISISADQPTVNYKFYDPSGPMPSEVGSGMKGHTHYLFNFGISCAYVREGEAPAFVFHFTTINLHLSLPITITLPNDASAVLRAHEEGHRKITTYFYKNFGEEAARRAAQMVAAKDVEITSPDKEQAGHLAVTQANDMVGPEYFKTTFDLARKANRYYDELTNHGRTHGVDQDSAADNAIQKYLPGESIPSDRADQPNTAP